MRSRVSVASVLLAAVVLAAAYGRMQDVWLDK